MRLVLVVAGIAAVSLAACGKKEEAKVDKPQVSVTADGYTVNTGSGTATVVTGAAAKDAKLPDFVPVYEGAKIDSSVSGLSKGDTTGGTLVYSVAATPEQVVAFYKEKAAKAGFATKMDANMGQAQMYSGADEATKRGVQVIASANDGKTNVQVIWAAPK